MYKIFSGRDRAKELGLKNYREMVALFAARAGRLWDGRKNNDPTKALYAFVNAGRWVAECECLEMFFVEPTEPFAFCAHCGNLSLGGAARLVIFPDNKDEIENELMTREVELPEGVTPKMLTTQDVGLKELVKPRFAPRNWEPGETPEIMKDKHNKAREAVVMIKSGEVADG